MKTTSLIAAALTAASSLVSAHTIFVQLEAGGTRHPVGHGVRVPTYDGPITDVSTRDVACNGGPNPTQKTDKIIQVRAGSTVTAVWRHTLTSGPGDVMDASHKGPTLAYLKKVDNALTDPGVGNGWFKIQEEGHSNGNWATSKVITNGGLHAITIPTCIPSGQYLLRAEMIALHGAGSSAGAQFYMECAQLNITGGEGTGLPKATVSFPGVYKASDPGILVNIYQMTPASKYTIPGPKVFACTDAVTAGGASPATPTTPELTEPEEPEALPEPTGALSGGGGGCQAVQWAQCGGTGFSGCTECAGAATCREINQYYSQCAV